MHKENNYRSSLNMENIYAGAASRWEWENVLVQIAQCLNIRLREGLEGNRR
ncbi:hypothetical protein M2480_003101 [Parabacteroides sp. PFB2-12]|nr:hypothetical protein [Parabacteroides sp. PM6-13]MDH6392093.1 hypothetical protein [Parabacteroides sp. PFB2-12]